LISISSCVACGRISCCGTEKEEKEDKRVEKKEKKKKKKKMRRKRIRRKLREVVALPVLESVLERKGE
jgi:hypothetical protein